MLEHPTLDRIDPEAAHLLREIAVKPDSILFRPNPRRPFDEVGALTPAVPLRLAAERQLVRVHGEELGLLFHELALRLILDGDARDSEVLCLFDHLPDGRPRSTDSIRSQLGGRRWANSRAISGPELNGEWGVFGQRIPSLAQVMRIAHSCRPSPVTSLNASLASLYGGRAAAAYRWILGIEVGELSVLHRLVFDCNAAAITLALGDPQRSLEFSRSAYLTSPLPQLAFGGVIAAWQAGDIKYVEYFGDALFRDYGDWDVSATSRSYKELLGRSGVKVKDEGRLSGLSPARRSHVQRLLFLDSSRESQ